MKQRNKSYLCVCVSCDGVVCPSRALMWVVFCHVVSCHWVKYGGYHTMVDMPGYV